MESVSQARSRERASCEQCPSCSGEDEARDGESGTVAGTCPDLWTCATVVKGVGRSNEPDPGAVR